MVEERRDSDEFEVVTKQDAVASLPADEWQKREELAKNITKRNASISNA